MRKFLVIIVLAGLTCSVIGLIQNHYNDPLRHCTQFRTFTTYKGYNCPGGVTMWTRR